MTPEKGEPTAGEWLALRAGERELYLTRPYLRGADVQAIQRRLRELGFDPQIIDGVFGPITEEAVIAFQRSRRLKANGVVSDQTFRALGFSPTPPTPPSTGGPRGRPGSISIVIETEARRMTVSSGPSVVRTYPVAVGKPSTPTPTGNWKVMSKIVNPDWAVLGTRWMGLSIPSGNYGIHGTSNPASIGHAVSNGCIRLHNRNVEELFEWARIGTPVTIVRGGSGGSGGSGSGGSGNRPVVSVGSRGPLVIDVQTRLRGYGFYKGTLDGVFGPVTQQAVMAFQESKGLVVDGVVGPRTWSALGY